MKPELLEALRSMAEPDLYRALYCDHLTGAHNRRAFEQDGRQFVAIVDLDSLKYVNDALGYFWGDKMLKLFADELQKAFGDGQVYRLGGDEFAIKSAHAIELRRALLQVRERWPFFSFGIGPDLATADKRLKRDKDDREKTGQRVARGECPPWMGDELCRP